MCDTLNVINMLMVIKNYFIQLNLYYNRKQIIDQSKSLKKAIEATLQTRRIADMLRNRDTKQQERDELCI